MITTDDIKKQAALLKDAKDRAYETGERVIGLTRVIEFKRAEGLADGSITGSNPDMREASARKVLAEDYVELARAEYVNRKMKWELEKAIIDWESLRMQLRLFEAVLARDSIVNVGAVPSYAAVNAARQEESE